MIWLLLAGLGGLALIGVFVWMGLTIKKLQEGAPKDKKSASDLNKAYTDIAEEDATHLFNTEFREELKNRGRMRFEKIIDENANFLKQDLDSTVQQLNGYMQK